LFSNPTESVYIGRTAFLRIPFCWNPSKLVNPHICVVGITGSGKSYFVKTFITRARLSLGAGAVIIDWAGEYSDWVRAAGGRVVCLGKEGVNLLELAGRSPHDRISQVAQSLDLLTDISSFPRQRALTEEALEQAYIERGFSLSMQPQKRRKPPTLRDAASILKKAGKKDGDAKAACRRLSSLLSSSGNSFCASTINLEGLVSSELVCIDLHPLPTESLRSLAGLAILQFIKERMRAQEYGAKARPRLFVVVDEAWKIAADERSDVVSIVREGRKYGFSLIVASQNPTDVHRSIFSSAGTVAAFRLTLASERDYLRSSLSYSGFFERLSHSLSVGQAIFHLEFSEPVACPKTFLLGMVDGEELLQHLALRGVGMELVFEKGALCRRLVSFGLSEKQTSAILMEFERRNYSLEAHDFISCLERFGHSRASAISLLRQMGASEASLLAAFSPRQANAVDVRLRAGAASARKAARAKRAVRKGGRRKPSGRGGRNG
jgi:DNA helicase HerA-like ATPase